MRTKTQKAAKASTRCIYLKSDEIGEAVVDLEMYDREELLGGQGW